MRTRCTSSCSCGWQAMRNAHNTTARNPGKIYILFRVRECVKGIHFQIGIFFWVCALCLCACYCLVDEACACATHLLLPLGNEVFVGVLLAQTVLVNIAVNRFLLVERVVHDARALYCIECVCMCVWCVCRALVGVWCAGERAYAKKNSGRRHTPDGADERSATCAPARACRRPAPLRRRAARAQCLRAPARSRQSLWAGSCVACEPLSAPQSTTGGRVSCAFAPRLAPRRIGRRAAQFGVAAWQSARAHRRSVPVARAPALC